MKLSRTKLYPRLLLSVLFVVCLALFSSISHAASSEGTSTQEPTISVPVSSWNELKGRLMKAESSINKKQGQELTKASNLLTTQEAKLNEASTSLEELTEQIKHNKRTEQRLKRQRDTWAVVSGVFGLVGAIRR